MRRFMRYFAILATLFVAALALAASKFPSMIGSRAVLAGYTSSVAGSLSTAMIFESGRFGFWVYNSSSTATPDSYTVIEPSDSPASGRWLLKFGELYGSITYTIAPSGGDFTDLISAEPALSGYAAAPNTIVTLAFACSTSWTETSSFRFTGGYLPTVKLHGCAPSLHTITSVGTPTGTAGNYSLVLQMGESVANITAGNDYLTINDASGTQCEQIDGGHRVTAVNAGANQVTIALDTQAASLGFSACTAAAVYDLSSTLKFNDSDTTYAGISVLGGSNLIIDNLNIVGNGTEVNGLAPQDNGRLLLTGPVVLDDWTTCFENSDNAFAGISAANSGGGLYATRCTTYGLNLNLGSMTNLQNVIVTGTNGVGVDVNSGASFNSANVSGTIGFLSEGNSGDGIDITNGGVFASFGETADNGGYGILNGGTGGNSISLFSFTNTRNGLGTCNTLTGSCGAAAFSNGAFLGSGQNFCLGDANSCIQHTAGSNPAIWSSSFGLDFNINQSLDLCNSGSYVNLGSNSLVICGNPPLKFTTFTTAGILVNNSSGTVSNDTAGVQCTGTPTSSFATDSHGIVTHC